MTQLQKVSGVATAIFTDSNGNLCVQYHNTTVWRKRPDGQVTLDTGGWRTATTKVRMNQAFSQFGPPYKVFQKNGNWFVRHRASKHQIPYPGNTLTLEG